jgi:hypothetical protein
MRKIAEIFKDASNPSSLREILNRDKTHLVNSGDLDLIKVWPKPGNRFVFLYKITDNGKSGWAVIYIFDPESDLAKRKHPKKSEPIPEWNGFIQRFPDDFRMPHLKAAVKVDQARQHLQSHLGNNGSKWTGFNIKTARLRGYWPGKRCQIEYQGNHPDRVLSNFYAKIYREQNGEKMISIYDSLRKAGFNGENGINTPQPIAYCQRLHALLMESSSGRSMSEVIDSPAGPEIISHSGVLIARFHKTKLFFPNPPHLVEEEIELVEGWRAVLSLLFKKEPDLIKSLLEKLTNLSFLARTPVASSHRDFHDNQLLFDGKVLTILDLDTACLAPKELDVGNFLSHLILRSIQNQADLKKYGELEHIFIHSYREEGGNLDDAAVSWYKAAALLRLACLYRIQPKGAPYFNDLTGEAENLLSHLRRIS